MTAQVIFLADRQPKTRPLPMPACPKLDVMVITLQRDHCYELTFRERVRLFRAWWIANQGDDADPAEVVEQMQIVHPIWKRFYEQPDGAA